MSNRVILVGSFIFPERKEWFLDYLKDRYNINKNEVFIFKNLDDESKWLFTFRLVLHDNKKINLKNNFPNSMIIHKKGDVIYTINALNKLIELESGLDKGNINHKNFEVDWDKYQNKLILTNNDELVISTIERIM